LKKYLSSQLPIKIKIMKTSTKWILDPLHSQVQFKVKHLVISTVTGAFKSFKGSLETEKEDFSGSKIYFSLEVDSVDTNQGQRDEHLRSAEFFNAEEYPEISFTSSAFEKNGDEYSLTGKLTIKKVTRTVTLAVEYGGIAVDFYGNTKAGFEISGKIDRKDFGLAWEGITEAGAVVVGAEIKLLINAQFSKES
jgi:polyisoprenoid-binding protein YceI